MSLVLNSSAGQRAKKEQLRAKIFLYTVSEKFKCLKASKKNDKESLQYSGVDGGINIKNRGKTVHA